MVEVTNKITVNTEEGQDARLVKW